MDLTTSTPGGFFAEGVIYHMSTLGLDTNRYAPEFWCTHTTTHPDTNEPVAFGFYRNHPSLTWDGSRLSPTDWDMGLWAAPGEIPRRDREMGIRHALPAEAAEVPPVYDITTLPRQRYAA